MRLFTFLIGLFNWIFVSAQTEHVILISIDGLRPEFYRDASWPAPNIQNMANEGASADFVRGIFPSVTYPSHTTILTGALPDKHGIYYNAPFEPGGQTGRWYWETELITSPTLWDAAEAKGLVTANLLWPVSVGALVDFNIPEVWSLDRNVDGSKYAMDFVEPKSLVDEIQTEASGRLNENTFSMDWMARDVRTGFIAAHLIERYKPNFLTIHLVGVDHFSTKKAEMG